MTRRSPSLGFVRRLALDADIARRFARSLRANGFARFATAVSIGSVALGSIALILAISILTGYEEMIERTAMQFVAHVEARPIGGDVFRDADRVVAGMRGLDGVADADVVLTREALIRTKHGVDGVALTGVSVERGREKIDPLIVHGTGVSDSGLVLGERLASALRVGVGDTVVIYAANADHTAPIIAALRVHGVFRSGMERYDRSLAVLPIDQARRVLRLPNDVASSVLVTCRSTDLVEGVAERVRTAIGPRGYVTTYVDSFQAMVAWIEIQKRPIPIVLGLISLVAVFSVISTLLIAVVEKTRSVAILMTLGMTPWGVMRVVLLRSLSIGAIGAALGAGIAFGALLAQRTWNIVQLDGAIYYVRHLPVSLDPAPFIVIPAVSITLCVLVSTVPMIIAARVRPARALRF